MLMCIGRQDRGKWRSVPRSKKQAIAGELRRVQGALLFLALPAVGPPSRTIVGRLRQMLTQAAFHRNALQELLSQRQRGRGVPCSLDIENDRSQRSSERKRRRKNRAPETRKLYSTLPRRIRHDSISRGLAT